jgi:hypothetical protein
MGGIKMAENTSKKEEFRKFLERVKRGLDFIEEIWVEREIKHPPKSDESEGLLIKSERLFCIAKTLSGKSASNVTELLRDDLQYSFERREFAFRFIAAKPGSGKTTIQSYLCQLIDAQSEYRKSAIIVKFRCGKLLSQAGVESFSVKFFIYALTQTFWEIMRKDNEVLSEDIKLIAEKSLKKIIGDEKAFSLSGKTDDYLGYCEQLINYLSEKKDNFQDRFFLNLHNFKENDSSATFVYLIDELDSLDSSPQYLQDFRVTMRELINEGKDKGLPIMVYIAGNSRFMNDFISPDKGLSRRVVPSIINLISFRKDECEKIKSKIEERIYDAYNGCQDFSTAWQEIKKIQLEATKHYNSLGEFCNSFAERIIEVHENYFDVYDKNFNQYENKARRIFEDNIKKQWSQFIGDNFTLQSDCQEGLSGHHGHTKWQKWKGKNGYSILIAQSNTNLLYKNESKHSLDCYAELYKGDDLMAKAYGEAKNYALIKEHINTFSQWLKDFDFKPLRTHPDLALIFSPSCTELQLGKLELKHIKFIKIEKIFSPPPPPPNTSKTINNSEVININLAELDELKAIFKGTKISSINTFNKLIKGRPYNSVEDLTRRMKFSDTCKTHLQKKFANGEISFDKLN